MPVPEVYQKSGTFTRPDGGDFSRARRVPRATDDADLAHAHRGELIGDPRDEHLVRDSAAGRPTPGCPRAPRARPRGPTADASDRPARRPRAAPNPRRARRSRTVHPGRIRAGSRRAHPRSAAPPPSISGSPPGLTRRPARVHLELAFRVDAGGTDSRGREQRLGRRQVRDERAERSGSSSLNTSSRSSTGSRSITDAISRCPARRSASASVRCSPCDAWLRASSPLSTRRQSSRCGPTSVMPRSISRLR